MTKRRPSVSVLICTCNRPTQLDRALGHLRRGTVLPDQLVVVNGGVEANEVVARHASAFSRTVLVQYRNHNLAVSRNLGLPRCSGEILAMTDDDAEVAADWLERMVDAHGADPAAGAIGGPVLGSRPERFLSRVADCVVFPFSPTRRAIHTLPGVNVSYKRAAVRSAGSFDPALDRGEDVDFNQRVARGGWSVIYDPQIRVRHEHRSTLHGLLLQQYLYGRAYVLVRRRHPSLYCVYPHSLHSSRDWLKLAHWVAATLYQPALASRRMPSPLQQLAAIPILVAHHVAWKLGMLHQLLGGTQASAAVTPVVLGVWEWKPASAEARCVLRDAR